MSKERNIRKSYLNKRVRTIKKLGCDYCGHSRHHTNGLRIWCCKCKREKDTTHLDSIVKEIYSKENDK